MATKNLSRTIREGGRCSLNQEERARATRDERAALRVALHQVEHDPDAADGVVFPKRVPVRRCTHEKAAPVARFVASKVGRPWGKAYREICATLDRRSIDVRRVVEDRVLRGVPGDGVPLGPRRPRFTVDARGILRERTAEPRRPVTKVWSDVYVRTCAWLAGRHVGVVGGKAFWFVPALKRLAHGQWVDGARFGTFYNKGRRWILPGERSGFVQAPVDAAGRQISGHGSAFPFRQDRALTREDLAFFRRLPEPVQREILDAAPVSQRR